MPITVACPSCGKRLTAPDTAAGKKAKCPSCGSLMMLPQPVRDAEVLPEDPFAGPPPAGGAAGMPPVGGFAAPPAAGGISELLDEADQTYSLHGGPAAARPSAAGGLPSGPAAEADVARRPCPACGEMIVLSALKCRYCGEVFDPALKKKRRGGYSSDDEDLTTGDWLIAILCSGIGCIAGIIWMIQGKPKGGKMLGVSLAMNVVWFVVRVVIEMATQNVGNP